MPIDLVSNGLMALSLMQGKGAQKRASRQAASAQSMERTMAKQAAELYAILLGKVKGFEAEGGFDPEKRFTEMRKTADREFDMSSARLAGDLRIAGGHPGERAVVSRLAGLRAKQNEALTRMKDQITQESFFSKLQAYNAANPSGPLGAAGIYGRQADRAYGQMQDPTAFFASMMPFLNQPGRSRSPTTVGNPRPRPWPGQGAW